MVAPPPFFPISVLYDVFVLFIVVCARVLFWKGCVSSLFLAVESVALFSLFGVVMAVFLSDPGGLQHFFLRRLLPLW